MSRNTEGEIQELALVLFTLCHMRMQCEDSYLQTREQDLTRHQICLQNFEKSMFFKLLSPCYSVRAVQTDKTTCHVSSF